jgi:hypothetical protein
MSNHEYRQSSLSPEMQLACYRKGRLGLVNISTTYATEINEIKGDLEESDVGLRIALYSR